MIAPSFSTLAELRAAFRRERKALRLTQQQVADRAGMRRETIIKLEGGDNIDALTLLKAIAALGKGLAIVDHKPAQFEELQNRYGDTDE